MVKQWACDPGIYPVFTIFARVLSVFRSLSRSLFSTIFLKWKEIRQPVVNSYRYCSIYHAVPILNDLNVLQWFQWMFVFDVEKRENSCSRGFSLQFSQTRSLAVDIDTLVIQHVPFFLSRFLSILFHSAQISPFPSNGFRLWAHWFVAFHISQFL